MSQRDYYKNLKSKTNSIEKKIDNGLTEAKLQDIVKKALEQAMKKLPQPGAPVDEPPFPERNRDRMIPPPAQEFQAEDLPHFAGVSE